VAEVPIGKGWAVIGRGYVEDMVADLLDGRGCGGADPREAHIAIEGPPNLHDIDLLKEE